MRTRPPFLERACLATGNARNMRPGCEKLSWLGDWRGVAAWLARGARGLPETGMWSTNLVNLSQSNGGCAIVRRLLNEL